MGDAAQDVLVAAQVQGLVGHADGFVIALLGAVEADELVEHGQHGAGVPLLVGGDDLLKQEGLHPVDLVCAEQLVQFLVKIADMHGQALLSKGRSAGAERAVSSQHQCIPSGGEKQ